MNVQTASQWALVFGAFLTALGLFLTAYQMRKNNLATQGQFLLNFDQLADRYDEVYYVLREAFDSGTPLEDGRFSPAQLLKCKEYMGFLEHAEVLIKLGSIDSKVFDDLFGHRVRALASCPEVMSATLKLQPGRWSRFSKLCHRLKVDLNSPDSPLKIACHDTGSARQKQRAVVNIDKA